MFVELFTEFERIVGLQIALAKTARSSAKKSIFVGHGGSTIWLELHYFLNTRLGLKCVEFNADPVAGVLTAARLDEMLDAASFAFLVMTAEDQHADGTFHARPNVIHEIGLFQGRLGARKAITLREEGCESYSNAAGVNDILFPRNNLQSIFHTVRDVLEREGLL